MISRLPSFLSPVICWLMFTELRTLSLATANTWTIVSALYLLCLFGLALRMQWFDMGYSSRDQKQLRVTVVKNQHIRSADEHKTRYINTLQIPMADGEHDVTVCTRRSIVLGMAGTYDRAATDADKAAIKRTPTQKELRTIIINAVVGIAVAWPAYEGWGLFAAVFVSYWGVSVALSYAFIYVVHNRFDGRIWEVDGKVSFAENGRGYVAGISIAGIPKKYDGQRLTVEYFPYSKTRHLLHVYKPPEAREVRGYIEPVGPRYWLETMNERRSF